VQLASKRGTVLGCVLKFHWQTLEDWLSYVNVFLITIIGFKIGF